MKKIHPLNVPLVIACLFVGFSIAGCQKNLDPQNIAAPLPDSVITGNLTLHYIYDAQERVIEERIDRLDSPNLIRRTYEYIGNDSLPWKRNTIFSSAGSANYSAVFSYNNLGQKTYDSAFFVPSVNYNSYSVITFDHAVPGRLAVTKNLAFYSSIYTQKDTAFLNNNTGNIDSIRTYFNGMWGTTRYAPYDSRFNFLKALSINQCNYYMSLPNNYAELYTGINSHPDQLLDYFNTTYCTGFSWINYYNVTVGSGQYQYQFNADNLPILRTLTNTNGINLTTRFVYR